jgi:hypothetical protein
MFKEVIERLLATKLVHTRARHEIAQGLELWMNWCLLLGVSCTYPITIHVAIKLFKIHNMKIIHLTVLIVLMFPCRVRVSVCFLNRGTIIMFT